jgi:hypothetical protein
MSYIKMQIGLSLVLCLLAGFVSAQDEARIHNMELVGQNNLGGKGDGGEGLALQMVDGRKILYFAHSGRDECFSVIDVTNPEEPELINQIPSPAPFVTRCNSLGLSGNILTVANEARTVDTSPAGLWVLDVSDFDAVSTAESLDDLAISFYDTSGEHSRGVHNVWFVDGEFAHLATGMPDFHPLSPRDDNLWLILDLRDPANPKEVGRWWLPGVEASDECLPECLPVRQSPFDNGYRPHQVAMHPDHPDRGYMGYIDGGAMIFDTSGLVDISEGRAESFTPEMISRVEFHPPYMSWTHTYQPMLDRQLAWASDEATSDNCLDSPKIIWLMDIRAETNPIIIDTSPLQENDGELCERGGRFGAHNIHPNMPGPLYANLQNTTVSAWFNGGIRIYHAKPGPVGMPNAPAQAEEIGYYVPPKTGDEILPTAQYNNVMVDSDGYIYVQERFSEGLVILKYTGDIPLD